MAKYRFNQLDDMIILPTGPYVTPVVEPPSPPPATTTTKHTPRPGSRTKGMGRSRAKLTPEDKQYAKWFDEYCDPYDVGRTLVNLGPAGRSEQKYQASNQELETHVNAHPTEFRLRLRRVTQRDLSAHRRDELTLHYHSRGGKTILIRLDADAHGGETDAREMIEWISSTFFCGRLYHESSPRGHAGYAMLDLSFPTATGYTYLKSATANRRIDTIRRFLIPICQRAGFQAKLEIQGDRTVIERDSTGHLRLVSRGRMGKLPRCPKEGDVDRLDTSHFPMDQILGEVQARLYGSLPGRRYASPVIATRPVEAPKTPVKSTKRRIVGVTTPPVIHDTGDKYANRVRCVSAAIKAVLGSDYDPAAVSEIQINEILDRADALYVSNGLNRGERDADRDRSFRAITKWMLTTHCPPTGKGKGGSPPWFNENDIVQAETLIRSVVASHKLDKINLGKARGLNRSRITYRTLALALVTFGKNSVINNGYVPLASIGGMLAHFHIRSNGSLLKQLWLTLVGAGLLKCVNAGYWAGHHCMRWSVTGATWNLAFLSPFQPRQGDGLVVGPGANPEANPGAGRGQNLISNTLEDFSPQRGIAGHRLAKSMPSHLGEPIQTGSARVVTGMSRGIFTP